MRPTNQLNGQVDNQAFGGGDNSHVGGVNPGPGFNPHSLEQQQPAQQMPQTQFQPQAQPQPGQDQQQVQNQQPQAPVRQVQQMRPATQAPQQSRPQGLSGMQDMASPRVVAQPQPQSLNSAQQDVTAVNHQSMQNQASSQAWPSSQSQLPTLDQRNVHQESIAHQTQHIAPQAHSQHYDSSSMASPVADPRPAQDSDAANRLRRAQAARRTEMSTHEAQELFKEEPATKKRKKRSFFKRLFKLLLFLMITGGIVFGGYVFLYGNKVAKDYQNSFDKQDYSSIFTKIGESISPAGVEAEQLTSGFDELGSVLDSNPDNLKKVYLGGLNKQYKSAQELDVVYSGFMNEAREFDVLYGDFIPFVSAVGESLTDLESLSGLDSVDLSGITAEELSQNLTGLRESCDKNSAELESSANPESLSQSIEGYSAGLVKICSGEANSLKSAINTLSGKTGVLEDADNASVGIILAEVAKGAKVMLSGSGDDGFATNDVTAYYRGLKESAESLKTRSDGLKR